MLVDAKPRKIHGKSSIFLDAQASAVWWEIHFSS